MGLPRGLTQEGNQYRIRFRSRTTRPGQMYRERLADGTTRRQAELYLSKLREDDRLGVLVWPNERQPVPPCAPAWTVADYAEKAYMPYCKSRCSPRTMRLKRDTLIVVAPWFGHLTLEEITPAVVVRYQAERLAEGVRARTVNIGWGMIRHMLNVAHQLGDLPHPPPQVPHLPERDKKPHRWLSAQEAERALSYALARSPMWYACTLTLLHTGARWGDVVALRWEDVDLKRGIVHYRAEASKQQRAREVPLLPEVIEALRVLPQDHELVFVRQHCHSGAWIPLHEKAKCLGGSYPWEGKNGDLAVGAHVWRHTFATWKLQAGVPITLVSRWLGHAKISITVDIYGHIETTTTEEISKGPRPQVQRLKVVGG